MSHGITHFAVGATCTLIIVTYLVPRVPYPRVIVILGGIWAMLPDANKLVDWQVLDRLHSSPVADIFWFHYSLDRIDSTDSIEFGVVAVAIFLIMTYIAERREYRSLNLNGITDGVETSE